MYQLYFSKRFLKQLHDLPDTEQQKVITKLSTLTSNPRAVSLKLLTTGPPIYRYRVGEYRLFFEIDEPTKEVLLTDILRRTTQTYR